MSSYLKQISTSESLIDGKNFGKIMDAVKAEAQKLKWEHYSWSNEVVAAKNLSDLLMSFGVHLVYEGDDKFTINVDGAYDTAFFPDLIKCAAPYLNDGEITVSIEHWIVQVVFKDGSATTTSYRNPKFYKVL